MLVRRRRLIGFTGVGVLLAVAALVATAVGSPSSPGPAGPGTEKVAASAAASGRFQPPPAVVGLGPTATPSLVPASAFRPIDVFATQAPPSVAPGASADPWFRPDARRPTAVQSPAWLALKAAGMIALVGGRVTVLDGGADPLAPAGPRTMLPAARTLDLSWTRAIVEPPGRGVDERGNAYVDTTYWNLCGPGAMAVALYYWQQPTGGPDVTGTAGYFLDPYAAAGVAWPSPGPRVTTPGGAAGTRGTYWSGSDRVSGYTAHARGYVMYLGLAAQPPGWRTPGVDAFSDGRGVPLYPTRGAGQGGMMTVLNWEAAGHRESNWAETWYTTVSKADPTLARDLAAAVMLDVGRDGVPLVASVDTFELPNWQGTRSQGTPHTRHAIAIVGYDNAASPPTYTYLDTCGSGCNPRPGNANGVPHTIVQSALVQAILDRSGAGFIW